MPWQQAVVRNPCFLYGSLFYKHALAWHPVHGQKRSSILSRRVAMETMCLSRSPSMGFSAKTKGTSSGSSRYRLRIASTMTRSNPTTKCKICRDSSALGCGNAGTDRSGPREMLRAVQNRVLCVVDSIERNFQPKVLQMRKTEMGQKRYQNGYAYPSPSRCRRRRNRDPRARSMRTKVAHRSPIPWTM